jgi:DNA-binding transcriptional ArsR family regulator
VDATERAELTQLHARLCQALADPKRLMLLTALRQGPRTVGELCAELSLGQANTSQHLAILRDRGVVSAERVGTTMVYQLRGDKVVKALDLLREFMHELFQEQHQLSVGNVG